MSGQLKKIPIKLPYFIGIFTNGGFDESPNESPNLIKTITK